MSGIEVRQMKIRSELEAIIASAHCLLEIMTIDGPVAAESMQSGADTIRMLADDLIENV